jgi:protoporphyrinogen IX oxidase
MDSGARGHYLPSVVQLIVLHVLANLVWIGSIASVGVVLAIGPDPKQAGVIAYGLYRRLSVPAFLISFVAAVALLATNVELYLSKSHWMHAKLPIALGVIVLHHVIGARAKQLANARRTAVGPVSTMTLALLVLAAAAATLGVAKPF